jgi:hypothetical protein
MKHLRALERSRNSTILISVAIALRALGARPVLSLSSQMYTVRLANHGFRSLVHAPRMPPPELVVAINPSAATLSASFSPSQIQTGASIGAAISSGNRCARQPWPLCRVSDGRSRHSQKSLRRRPTNDSPNFDRRPIQRLREVFGRHAFEPNSRERCVLITINSALSGARCA